MIDMCTGLKEGGLLEEVWADARLKKLWISFFFLGGFALPLIFLFEL